MSTPAENPSTETQVEEQKPGTEAEKPAEQAAPEGAEQQSTEAEQKPAEEAAETNETDEAKDAELPDWARTELSRVRGEAASYRTKLRDAEAKLEGAKTIEEFEAATAELKSANADLERQLTVTKLASKHGLPAELAELLKGDSPDELEAHAKQLAKFAPPSEEVPESLAGGVDPTQPGDKFDPVAAARKARRLRF